MQFIYLHGFASGPSSTKARYFQQRFAEEGLDLAIPDLCEGNFEGMTITGMLAVIERLVAGSPSTLIGSSLGGYLAALSAAHNTLIKKLVLLAPGFCFPQRWPEILGQERLADWQRTGKLSVYHYSEGRQCSLGWQFAEDARKYEGMPGFHQPALIYHGIRDTVVPHDLSAEFAGLHPNAELRLLDSGHELTDVLGVMWVGARKFLIDEPRA